MDTSDDLLSVTVIVAGPAFSSTPKLLLAKLTLWPPGFCAGLRCGSARARLRPWLALARWLPAALAGPALSANSAPTINAAAKAARPTQTRRLHPRRHGPDN